MQDLHEAWGEEIARCLKDQCMSGRELARRCGVNPSVISRVIAGKRNADDELKWKIAGALGVRMDLLFSYPRVVPPSPVAAQVERLTFTVPEVAQLIGVSESLAYRMASDGRLPTIDCGRRRVVPKVALERLLAEAS